MAKARKKSTASKTEVISVKGQKLLKKLSELVKQGNVRRITILNKNNHTIMVIPLTLGVVGTVLAPPLAVVGALAALVTECTIKVERTDKA